MILDKSLSEVDYLRNRFMERNMDFESEYLYQLKSFLMESEKLLEGKFFATDYIEEKAGTLVRIAINIKRERSQQ
jgi:hypothetical protein